MRRFVITTSHRPTKEQVMKAKALAESLKADYIPRRILKELVEKGELDFYYVVEKGGRLVIRWKGGEFFFHPSVSILRMRNIRNGQRDYLIESLELEGNEKVLDLTFGLGSEAILIAAFLPFGKVIGLEKSIHIYTVVSEGIRSFKTDLKWLREALSRIELFHEDFKDFIRKADDESFDVVYCDPMFENPKYESSSMNPLRPFAVYDTVDEDDLKHMVRIARKRVVLKSCVEDSLFRRIKVDEIVGSRKSGVIYGIIRKRG